jgi:hypothetical protein
LSKLSNDYNALLLGILLGIWLYLIPKVLPEIPSCYTLDLKGAKLDTFSVMCKNLDRRGQPALDRKLNPSGGNPMKLINWTSLASLQDTFNSKSLSVKPRRRSYLSQSDAVYDYMVGHDVVITDTTSPYNGSVMSILDRDVLKRDGYVKLHIHYNNDQQVEVAL